MDGPREGLRELRKKEKAAFGNEKGRKWNEWCKTVYKFLQKVKKNLPSGHVNVDEDIFALKKDVKILILTKLNAKKCKFL